MLASVAAMEPIQPPGSIGRSAAAAATIWDNWAEIVESVFQGLSLADVHAVLIHGTEQRQRENEAAARVLMAARGD